MMMMEFRQSKLSQLRGGSSLNFLALNALKLSVETKKRLECKFRVWERSNLVGKIFTSLIRFFSVAYGSSLRNSIWYLFASCCLLSFSCCLFVQALSILLLIN